MIDDRAGNIFLSEADVLTVTVNCEGVMGAGIALEARLRWPELFVDYQAACESGDVRIGRVWLWEGEDFPLPGKVPGRQRVLCFPTKNGWRAPSKLSYIEDGLEDLVARYHDLGITSLAMPYLGASHGRLSWSNVRPVVDRALAPLEDLHVELWAFEPTDDDPWLEALRSYLGPEPFDEQRVKERLDLSQVRQAGKVIEALRSPALRGLSDLAAFLGETTLEAVYRHLRRPKPDQGAMF